MKAALVPVIFTGRDQQRHELPLSEIGRRPQLDAGNWSLRSPFHKGRRGPGHVPGLAYLDDLRIANGLRLNGVFVVEVGIFAAGPCAAHGDREKYECRQKALEQQTKFPRQSRIPQTCRCSQAQIESNSTIRIGAVPRLDEILRGVDAAGVSFRPLRSHTIKPEWSNGCKLSPGYGIFRFRNHYDNDISRPVRQ